MNSQSLGRLLLLAASLLLASSLAPAPASANEPFHHQFSLATAEANSTRFTANIQPVTPVPASEDQNVIFRSILPVIHAKSPAPGGDSTWGLGDTAQSFFLSPKAPNKFGNRKNGLRLINQGKWRAQI
jgi:hypothetical protein